MALGAAVHIFVGMIEAPLLVRPYLARMQRGELFALMTCGMAGVAGTVMVIYAVVPRAAHPERARQHPDRLGDQHAGRARRRGADGAVRSRGSGGGTTGHRRSAAQRDGRAGEGHRRRRSRAGRHRRELLVAVAFVALVNMALGELPHWGDGADHVAAHLRLAVPPGDVADRHAVERSRHRRDADGHQDRAERVRRLCRFLRAAAGRASRHARG